jgi:hypothetical protein
MLLISLLTCAIFSLLIALTSIRSASKADRYLEELSKNGSHLRQNLRVLQ